MKISFLIMLLISSVAIPQTNNEYDWHTFFEKTDYKNSPSYDETISYFKKFEEFSPHAKMVSFGKSPQERELECIIISKDKFFTPEEAKASGKPVVLIINSIHAGELEGKDASMLLLREILVTKEKEHLIDNLVLIIVPIFNVDGHERRSPFNRINQDGPEEMGWRTTAQNLNLNRDWLKLDAPEMQSFIKFYSKWLPDFMIDSHTTNGADYQYTITYGIEKFQNVYSETANWIRNNFIPHFEKSVEAKGFLIAPYVGFKDNDLNKGIVDWVSPARLSTGYTAAQNRPSLLIETHMLKPFKERVFATKAGFETVLEFVNADPSFLVELNKRADNNSVSELMEQGKFFPLSYKGSEESVDFIFKGIKSVTDSSIISGSKRTTYTGEKFEMNIPFFNESYVTDSINAPEGYFLPAEWKQIADRMKIHGINIHELKKDTSIEVIRYKFKNVKFASASYESHQTVTFETETFKEKTTLPAGTYFIPSDQRCIKVIMYLLEPGSDDSFIRWGFFNSIFERKEYFERYVMEKIAGEMIKDDPSLLEEFNKKLLEDEEFANSPYARLNFFYERTPYFDKQWNLYPVMRLESNN
jgi:hypothetical protein